MVDKDFDHPPTPGQPVESRPDPSHLGQNYSPNTTSNDGLLLFDHHTRIYEAPNNNSSPSFVDFSVNFFDDPMTSPANNLSPFTPIDEDFQPIEQERFQSQLSKTDGERSHDTLDCKCAICLHSGTSS